MKKIYFSLLTIVALMSFSVAQAQDNYLGEIRMFAGTFAPNGWAKCEGQLLPISQNQALFALLGITYGGNGQTTFALPDLRGRAPIAPGTGPGLGSITLGESGGVENVNILTQNLPAHSHGISVSSIAGTSASPVGGFLANTGNLDKEYGSVADGVMNVAAVTPTGSNVPLNVRSPYLSVTFIIALQGIFPSPQ